jgi:uncharacterized protein YodC (DUF2158 family)
MSSDFHPGDIVTHKSGGPRMTVRNVEGGKVICIRIEDEKKIEQHFEPAELTLEEEALSPSKEDGD